MIIHYIETKTPNAQIVTVMRENKDKVSKVIRALLLSAKHGLTVNELCSEYAALESKPLPYRELGYNSAIEMVKDMPEVIKPIFYGSAMILQGMIYVEGKFMFSNAVKFILILKFLFFVFLQGKKTFS